MTALGIKNQAAVTAVAVGGAVQMDQNIEPVGFQVFQGRVFKGDHPAGGAGRGGLLHQGQLRRRVDVADQQQGLRCRALKIKARLEGDGVMLTACPRKGHTVDERPKLEL